MNGQDDRNSRKFQPEINETLERRDVPASLTDFNPVSFITSKIITAAKGQNAPAARPVDWTSVEGWSWLKGTWKSKTSIDVFGAIAASLGDKNSRMPSIPSIDTWNVVNNKYVGKSALAAAQSTEMPVDGLIITPGATPTFAMTSADGSEPVELKMVSSTKNSITFAGSSQITGTGTSATDNTAQANPVQVTVTRRSANTLRVTAEIKMDTTWVRLFSYTATKVNGKV
ncbi:MAG: hypothetical protein ACKO85_01885 [Isosphaeraceae bacterium]